MSTWHAPRTARGRERLTVTPPPPRAVARHVPAHAKTLSGNGVALMVAGAVGFLVTLMLALSPAATTVGLVVSSVVVAVGWDHTSAPSDADDRPAG